MTKNSHYAGLNEQDRFDYFYQSILIDNEIMYMGSLLQRGARLFSDKPVLMYQDTIISYKELYYRACLLSAVLREKGVKKDDRVLLWFENSVEFYIAYFAVAQLGAVVAPLNVFLGEKELTHIIADAQPSCILVSQVLREKLPKDIQLPPIVTEDAIEQNVTVPNILPDFRVVMRAPDQVAALLYTSGTTGVPKGVMLSSKNIMTNITQGMARLKFGMLGRERVFGVLPLFHSFAQFACVWAPIFAGCATIIVPKIDRRRILEALKHKPTIFLGVPALYGLLCLMKTAPLDEVKYFVSGGDALSDKIRSYFALLYGRKICSGYGLTETSPLISVDLDDVTASTSTVGKPALGIECAVKDEQGNDVQSGQVGELWVRGDNIMLGYYNAPEATQKVMQDGWFKTGDLVYFDAYGKIVISGREKDLIIHKGFNIYPQEIENVLLTHANVIRAAVIGRKDEQLGEIAIAYVQLRKEDATIARELKQLCKNNLAAYKTPREFHATTKNLPTTATGKINKKVLKAEYEPAQN